MLFKLIKNALQCKCPQCQNGKIYSSYFILNEVCPNCDFNIQKRAGDCWAFMYVTTAGLTGALLLFMFLINPSTILLGQIIMGFLAVLVIVLTLPHRKSLALALDYYFEKSFEEKS